jgi:hypothetical protein
LCVGIWDCKGRDKNEINKERQKEKCLEGGTGTYWAYSAIIKAATPFLK